LLWQALRDYRCSKAQGDSFKMPENRANSRNLHCDSAIFFHFLHSFSANSAIEHGAGNILPLWTFGLTY
jgi:hypothetical protein